MSAVQNNHGFVTNDRHRPPESQENKNIIKIGFGPKQASKLLQKVSKQGASGAHFYAHLAKPLPDHDSLQKAYESTKRALIQTIDRQNPRKQ